MIIRYRVAQVPGADSCAAKAERDFDKHPLSLDDLVNAQTAYIERVKASVETESARKLASEALSFGHYSKPLVEAFAAADAYLETPPFQPGHLVVRRDAPQDGYLIVVGCARCGNGWRVESKMRNGIGGEIGDATNYILIPVGWRDPPLAPMSHLARLELSTDGPLWAEDIAEARAADAERGAESATGMREMAAWHLECGILVNPNSRKTRRGGRWRSPTRSTPGRAR